MRGAARRSVCFAHSFTAARRPVPPRAARVVLTRRGAAQVRYSQQCYRCRSWNCSLLFSLLFSPLLSVSSPEFQFRSVPLHSLGAKCFFQSTLLYCTVHARVRVRRVLVRNSFICLFTLTVFGCSCWCIHLLSSSSFRRFL